MDFIQTIIISIVEGLTEFLPVSSTGHMIIVENFEILLFRGKNFGVSYDCCILCQFQP